tara:strand:+ start:2684 stop:2812 length:129 start_codon:yes stop_codon:yes gene_type:complete
MRFTGSFCQKRNCFNLVRSGFRFCYQHNCGETEEEIKEGEEE